jgi:hypothetical protein
MLNYLIDVAWTLVLLLLDLIYGLEMIDELITHYDLRQIIKVLF